MNEIQAILENSMRRKAERNEQLRRELAVMIPKLNRAQRELKESREQFRKQYGYDPLTGKPE